MTTINPMRPFGTSAVIVQSDINPEWTYVGAAGHYKTAQIHAALGVTAKAEVAGLRRDLRVAESAADEWKARAEKAEATVERVRDLTECGAHTLTRETIRATLADKPAFTLPTEAGARFTAQGKYDAIGQRTEFITFTGGAAPRYIVADKDEDVCYTGAGVMTHYEDHRLIGADE